MRDLDSIHQREERKKKAELDRELTRKQEASDLQKVLSTPEGKRLMIRLVRKTGVMESSFTGNSQTFFNEGRRDIGRFILDEVERYEPKVLPEILTDVFKKEIE